MAGLDVVLRRDIVFQSDDTSSDLLTRLWANISANSAGAPRNAMS